MALATARLLLGQDPLHDGGYTVMLPNIFDDVFFRILETVTDKVCHI